MEIRQRYDSYAIFILIMSVMFLTGCSESTSPDSLEPIIELSEAEYILRTEATMTATIDRRGAAKLSYITLIYSEAGSEAVMSINGNPAEDKFEFRLTDLKPGSSYMCHIEGGTKTATLKSNVVNFTTVPNELPKLSSPIPLSTGPLGIIVEFTIIDDGGEAITETGCDIREIGSAESRRVYISGEKLDVGSWQLNIKGLKPETTYTIAPFASNSMGESHGDALEYTTKSSIVLQRPGVLASIFGNDGDFDLENLTISGYMNGDDFKVLRSILGAPSNDKGQSGKKPIDIDLSDVIITEDGGAYDGSHFCVADQLTTEIFADCSLLRSAILPTTAKRIARNAFARCKALETFTVSAEVDEVLPSSECTALKFIDVSKANSRYASIDGVLFNHDGTQIIWFPTGKTGDYKLPPTITTIGENAFAGTSIDKLIIPATVTYISRGAFAGSTLTEIILPDNITNISEGMFQNCSSLTDVYLGAGTEYIGNFAFDGTSVSSIFLAAEIPPYVTDNAFANGDSTIFEQCTLYVPKGRKKVYSNHNKWGNFNHIQEFQP